MIHYTILPFQFKKISENNILMVNECGDFIFISEEAFHSFARHEISEYSEEFYKLKSHLFCAEKDFDISLRKTAARYRTRKSFLREFTSLHMMVVTLRCNQRCEYCQVSCADKDVHDYDMSKDTAMKVIDMIFQSPTKRPKIEFQGGEPLLNWDVVVASVLYAEELARQQNRQVTFVICTNLTTITHEQLEFCKEHNIALSTSLDGGRDIHDACRKDKSGRGTYDAFMKKFDLAREMLGQDMVGALMTTTADSLNHLKEIVDEYVRLDLGGIFIRSLNPYGFAAQQAARLGYDMKTFVEKYLDVLKYIMELNRKVFFPEQFATLLFARILSPFATGFVDLQSPSGAGISGAVYDFDGSVFPADEARMLARMGNRYFCLGNVKTDTYQQIFAGKKLKETTSGACLETTFPCAFCVYQAYCGTDPVRNYLETESEVRNMVDSPFCIKHRGIFTGLFDIIKNADDVTKDIIWSWITNNPALVKRK